MARTDTFREHARALDRDRDPLRFLIPESNALFDEANVPYVFNPTRRAHRKLLGRSRGRLPPLVCIGVA